MYLKTLKALLLGLCIAAVGMISWTPNSLAAEGNLDQQVQELIQQNQALTDRLNKLEQRIAEPKATTEPAYAGVAGGFLSDLENRITINGLLEFGGAYRSVDMNVGGHEKDSDLAMTTVELGIAAEVNDWVSAEIALLYEDPIFENDDTSFDVDTAIITIANTEETPAFLMAGKMFVPFGALLEHFPDDPLIDAPLTLCLGEINEKALLIGAELEGFTVSAYVFNGDVEEAGGGDNVIESYGFDANYAFEDETQDLDMLVGASYISNIADSDGIEGMLDEDLVVEVDGYSLTIAHDGEIKNYTPGAAVYFHVGYQDFFFDAEYMTATEEFGHGELLTGRTGNAGAKPEVWNIEVGYNYNWWRNLEITLKVAGSDDCEGLGFPRERYGINFNQEIFDDTVFSVGYMYDYYDKDDHADRNSQDLVFSQIAVEF